jgi:fibronectin type 3 domain-containing protein
LTWEPVEDASGYEIYRTGDLDDPLSLITTVRGGSDTSFVDTDVSAGLGYWYNIRAYNGAGPGEMSDILARPFIVRPGEALNLKAEALSSSEISVSWDEVAGTHSYILYRSKNSDFSDYTIVDDAIPSLNYKDSGLDPNTVYYYKVRASNPGGEGPLSKAASAKTKLAPPDWVNVEILDARNVVISWAPVDGADSYRVFFGSGFSEEPFNYIVADNTPYTEISDSFVEIFPGAMLRYRVHGVERDGNLGDGRIGQSRYEPQSNE